MMMKNILPAIIILLLLIPMGCKKNIDKNLTIDIFTANGLSGSPIYICFINKNEGYAFSNLQNWNDMPEQNLADSSYTNIPKNIATIYKTFDRGKNWTAITQILNSRFKDIAIYGQESIYAIEDKDSSGLHLIKFNTSSNKIEVCAKINSISSIWTDNDNIYYTNNNKNNVYIHKLNSQLIPIASSKITDYSISSVKLDENYCILANSNTTYFGIVSQQISKVDLPIIPYQLSSINDNDIIITGKDSNKDIVQLLNYSIKHKTNKVLKEFKGYTIVQGLQSNDKVIIGLLGNIRGVFTEYDLFYSLDKGKSWNIKKLKEENYVRPMCLYEDTLYIYSGGNKFQRIVFSTK